MTELLFAGVIISLAINELTGYSPGGIVVPAYFAMFLKEPVSILLMLSVAAISVVFVRFISKQTILYGQRRFAVFIITAMMLRISLGWVFMPISSVLMTQETVVGIIVPGLLAKDIDRQGFVQTLTSLAVAAGMTYLTVRVLF